MTGVFTIRQKLPSLNEVINAQRTNRYMGNKFKQDIESAIGMYIKQALTAGTLEPMEEQPCEVFIDWHEATQRRDADNIQSAKKFILDALQKEGVLKRDSRKYVKQIHDRIIDDKEDFVVVRLIPYVPQ